ncbi:MAG: hypothetical protein DRI32_03635 [Chloroflexi bacterium]|nr:MAG: hypothetical protein DRI32_03635 [Chloroflexota bacterium]
MKRSKIMNKKVLGVLLALSLLAVSAFSVAADSGTIDLIGGTLSVTTADVVMSSVTLDGTNQVSISPASSNNWTATDARGSGAGWNLAISATNFSDGAGQEIDISQPDTEFKIQLLDADVTVINGNAKPTSLVTTLTPIPNAGTLKFLSAATGEGMGSYAIHPSFALEIPADLHVGAGGYTSTITVTAVTGP